MTVMSLKAIDGDYLEDVEDNPEALEFSVLLSGSASEAWKQEFEQAYRQTPYILKPPVEVEDDRLKVIFLPRYQAELEGYFKFLSVMVNQANEELRRTAEIQASHTQDQRKAEFRQALARVQLPIS